MARNAMESDFQSSIMVTGGHLWINLKQIKVAYWFEMVGNAIKSDFRSYKMADDGHFVKKTVNKKKLRIHLK